MDDTPGTPDDELEGDLELTAEEGDGVAGGAAPKQGPAKPYFDLEWDPEIRSAGPRPAIAPGDGSV